MGVQTTNMQFFLALITGCLLLLLINVDEVVSRKSPVASITKDDLMRSSTTPNLSFKAKRSDGSALRSDSDTIEAHLHHDHQPEDSDSLQVSLEDASNSTNSNSSEDSSLPESNEDLLSNATLTAKAMGNNSDKKEAGGGVDSDVIIGCVIMAVIIVLGLGIGLGLNIYGKRQDISRDAAEFGIMDDLVEIHSNPDAH